MSEGPDAVELMLSMHSDRFDADDERWITQELDLLADLARETGGVRRESIPATGDKGAVEAVILALGSAQAFTAAVQCWKAWLSRDRTRRIEVAWTIDGRRERIVVQGTAVDDATFAKLAQAIQVREGDQ
ncbi:effector-associated constant component EACC1 [Phytohabitans houttuyneae]|uniref:Uncharacterized protein n=1 Tax=Phytohabitans houttuyneae TaxID=1076126 RepID=A0A6V8KR88_9ACTN|nr:hypothetical protein [Phytohabitans houttuyneae]GFJ84861.1 hypothetical protein Phou_090410 [Phytohabitans houttuyneae]